MEPLELSMKKWFTPCWTSWDRLSKNYKPQGQPTALSTAVVQKDFGNLHTANGLPQMHFDQFKAVISHFDCIKYGDSHDLYETQKDEEAIIHQVVIGDITPHKLTRLLKSSEDWTIWQKSERKHLNS